MAIRRRSVSRARNQKRSSSKSRTGRRSGKRPLGPYMLFAKANRKKVVKQNPSASFGQIGKLLGSQWNRLPTKEKRAYQLKAKRGVKRSKKSGKR